MAKIRGYMAASADGYIADENGGVDWLEPFNEIDYDFESFLGEIGTVVMGRKTYDQVQEFGSKWPYAGKRSIIVTSRPLENPPQDVTRWNDNLESLVQYLRQLDEKDVWIVGGVQLQSALFDLNAIDQLELFIIPVKLGKGIALAPSMEQLNSVPITATKHYDMGVVRKDYQIR